MKFFEFGRIYHRNGKAFREEERLALYMTGRLEAASWQNKPREAGYHDLLQRVQHVFEKSGAPEYRLEKVDHPLLDYGMKIGLAKRDAGIMGKVRNAFAHDLGIRHEVFYAELDTHLLFQSANPKFDIQEVPKFPEVKRDLSLVIDKSVTFDDIKAVVTATGKELITDVTVFDVYEGENIPKGKKAYALGFTLLDRSKTLTDQEIDNTMNGLMAGFEKRLGALIRK